MKRRTVSTITKYLEPKRIFKLITAKSWPYAPTSLKEFYECRDRAFMATSFLCAGRVSAICGGSKELLENGKVKIIGQYLGLMRKNLDIKDDLIRVTEMKVVKRTQKLIERRGEHVTIREPFMFPLKKGLFSEEYGGEYGDQLVPFTWLLYEYLNRFFLTAKDETRLFAFKEGRAWQIVKEVTGKFPNWFRAQSEHFYGHYVIRDSVKLAKFIGIQNPAQVGHYIGFSYESLLKEKGRYMDFKWIDKAIEKIKVRINGH